MAGGHSIWVSKDVKNDPRAIFNWRLFYLLITVSWAGCFYGFDSGNIGGILTLKSFQNAFGYAHISKAAAASRKGTIAAMISAGASAGSLLAAPTSDFLGRKWSIFLWGCVFLVGATLQMIANYDVLLAGRFLGGLGVGATSMLTPQFLAENAPRNVRGSMTAFYNLNIILSLMLAFWVNYGVSRWHSATIAHDNSQWRTAMSIQLIPGALMVLQVLFVRESPRYLINKGKNETGLKNLCYLRKLPEEHPYVQTEYAEMTAQVAYEQECYAGRNPWVIIKDIFLIRSNLRRFFLAVMLFLFHKFTGTDSLNYFAPEIFALIGVKSNVTLLTTGVYGVVKFVTSVFYVAFLVDRIGRRLPLLVGATMQATSMLYLALYLRFAGTNTTSISGTPAGGIVGILAIYIYAFGWSFGHSVACYVVAAEIFPTRIRSTCMSFCFFVNWIVDYGITRATPTMINEMGWGVFLMYAMLTYSGVVFIYFCLPELKGRSIESMDDLFQQPLYLMWKHAYPKSEEDKVRHDVIDKMHGMVDMDGMGGEKSATAHIEQVRA